MDPSLGALVVSDFTFLAPKPLIPPTAPVWTVGVTNGCSTIPECLANIAPVAAASGGATIFVPAGTYYMGGGTRLLFPNVTGATVALVGAGMDNTTILWQTGSGQVQGAPVTGAGSVSSFILANLTLQCNTPIVPQGATPLVSIQSTNASWASLYSVRLVYDLSLMPGWAASNAFFVNSVPGVSIVDSYVIMAGACTGNWPLNTAFYVDNGTDFSMVRTRVEAGCQGWSISSSSRIFMIDNAFVATGEDSEGQGFLASVDRLYFGNNTNTGNWAATERWESMTYDGPGGWYNGTVAGSSLSPDGQSEGVMLAAPLTCRVPGPNNCLPEGSVVAVIRGTGTGQLRRYIGNNGTQSITVSPPFDPPLVPGDSYLTITWHRGGATFEGNTYTNGTVFQFYGSAQDTIVAGNTFNELFTTPYMNTTAVAAGVRFFGHRYIGGYQPDWYATIEHNNITCATQFLLYSDNFAEDGTALSLGHIARKNMIAGGVNLAINLVHDAVAEHNVFAAAYCVWAGQTLPAGTTVINATSPGTLVR